MIKGGILNCSEKGVEVDFSRILWFKSYCEQKKILQFWHEEGYAEAEDLPYFYMKGCLMVTRDLPSHGFAKGSNTLCQEIYNLPF